MGRGVYSCHISPSDILKNWERTEEFAMMDERRAYYHRIVDTALKLDYGLEIDGVMGFISASLEKDIVKRRMIATGKKLRRWQKRKGRDKK